jgi:RHS repeat-associated protein
MDEGGILERVLSLPGGASVTVRADEEVWSYPNLQGSVAAIADGQGAKTGGTFTYDPFGRPLAGHPDSREGDLDGGWLGSVGREGGAGGGLIEMGARVYSPLLGRFLQVDPVAGGSANDYDYGNGDPINSTDRSGTDPIAVFSSYAAFHADRAVGFLVMIWRGHCRSMRQCLRGYAYSASYHDRWRGKTKAAQQAYAAHLSWAKAAAYAKETTWRAVRYAAAAAQQRIARSARAAATAGGTVGAVGSKCFTAGDFYGGRTYCSGHVTAEAHLQPWVDGWSRYGSGCVSTVTDPMSLTGEAGSAGGHAAAASGRGAAASAGAAGVGLAEALAFACWGGGSWNVFAG